MGDEAGLCSHSLHGIEGQHFGRTKRKLTTGDVNVLAIKLWPIILPCLRNRPHGEDALELLSVSHAIRAEGTESCAIGAGLTWKKNMVAIMEPD